MTRYLLAIDQGTTSTRAVVFNQQAQPICQHQLELKQYFPQDGWVEHDPEEIAEATLICCRKAIQKASIAAIDIAGMGISNQRETTVIWDRNTGKTIHRAIVWQDRRTADYCEALRSTPGLNETISQKTGLLLDPYFSATKIHWILDSVPGARERAEKGELAFGTIDTFLLWRLTDGQRHATDATNASRTLLFNIHTQEWDQELLDVFDIPRALLPEVFDNCANFGVTEKSLFGDKIPITGMAGDQQAATFGQCCFEEGMIKSTYGTGCFVMLNTGNKVIQSKNRLLSTIAYRLNGEVTYGLEGSIFVAGAAVQWLRDAMNLIEHASDTQAMALDIGDTGGVYLVPAFTGLGAPYWDPKARGALFGLTRNSGVKQIARAALEAVCYQTRDLLEAMQKDGATIESLRVDGGMTANNWLLQFLANILDIEVERPICIESSAKGAALLAGLGAGLYSDLEEISKQWHVDQHFSPDMPAERRKSLYLGWKDAISRITTV